VVFATRNLWYANAEISRFATQKLGVRGMHFSASGWRWIAHYEQIRASFWGWTRRAAVCILEMTVGWVVTNPDTPRPVGG